MAYVEVVGENPPSDTLANTERPKPSNEKPVTESAVDDDDPTPKRFVKKYD
jgi:hypothetical protein